MKKNHVLSTLLTLAILACSSCKKERSPDEICEENLIGEFESTRFILDNQDYSSTEECTIEFALNGTFKMKILGQKAEGEWDVKTGGDIDLDFDFDQSAFYLPMANCDFDCTNEIELDFTTTDVDGNSHQWSIELEKN